MRIRQNGGAFGDHRLPEHAVTQHDLSSMQAFADRGGHGLVGKKPQAEQLRGDLSGDIVRRRPEPAGDQKNVAAREGGEQRLANGATVRNGRLPGNAQPQREELLSEIGKVRVRDAPEQELRSGIENFNVHRGKDGSMVRACKVRRRTDLMKR